MCEWSGVVVGSLRVYFVCEWSGSWECNGMFVFEWSGAVVGSAYEWSAVVVGK